MLTRMRLRLLPVLAVICCAALPLLLGMPGCDKGNSATKTIGVVPKGLSHVFWKSVKAGADRAGKELGVQIKWDGPPNESEVNTQMRIIGDMRNRGVDALVVAPVSKTAISDLLAESKKKMPVVVFDSGSTFTDYDAFVATDNYKGGQLAGQAMLKLLGDRKNVKLAMIRRAGSGEAAGNSDVRRLRFQRGAGRGVGQGQHPGVGAAGPGADGLPVGQGGGGGAARGEGE